MSLEKNLSEILNIEVEPKAKKEIVTYVPDETDNDIEHDFKQSRLNIKEAIRKGNDALDGVLDLAASADAPRPYEVAATLVKTLVEANKDLMNLHQQKKDLLEEDLKNRGIGPQIDKAVIFVGTSAEIQKKIRESNNV